MTQLLVLQEKMLPQLLLTETSNGDQLLSMKILHKTYACLPRMHVRRAVLGKEDTQTPAHLDSDLKPTAELSECLLLQYVISAPFRDSWS